MTLRIAVLVSLAAAAAAPAAHAQDAGDWIWRAGVHSVQPKSDNHDVVNVDRAATLTLQLDPSFGPAAQAGLDISVGSEWFVNIDARWFDIDTDASLDSVDFGTVEVDPYALGVSIGRRF